MNMFSQSESWVVGSVNSWVASQREGKGQGIPLGKGGVRQGAAQLAGGAVWYR